MSEAPAEPLDCEFVDAEPIDDAPDDTVDAEVLDDGAPTGPDVITLDISVEPGTEVDIRAPNRPAQDPDAPIDAEIEEPSLDVGRQTEHDGARPGGGAIVLPRSEPGGANGKGGAKSRSSWNPFGRRRRGGSGGGYGGGGGLTFALIGRVDVLSGNRAEANGVKASASGNTGIGTGRRPSAGRRRKW